MKVTPRPSEEFLVASEYRLLNAIALSPVFLEDSRVYVSLLPHPVARSLFASIQKMHEQGITITPASLFQHANELDFNVTTEAVNQVLSIDAKAPDKIDDILGVLDKAKRKLEVQNSITSLSRMANQKGDLDTGAISAQLYEAQQLLTTNNLDKQLLKDLDSWMETYIEDLKARAGGKRYPFGDVLLDAALVKGAYPGAITTIAGATGQGKSAFALNLINGMINQGIPCMYISLEMSDIDTMDRLVSLRCNIATEDLYNPGDALDSIVDIVQKERKKLTEESKPFYFVDEPNLSMSQIHALIKEFKQRTRSKYLVAVIDLATQVQDFTKTSQGMNLANSIEMAMNQEAAIAKTEGIHFINVVQFNRNADSLKITEFEDLRLLRPSLNDIKNANAIAERSRAVLGLFRPKYYADRYLPDDPNTEALDDILEVQVLKQSNGRVPLLKYMCDLSVFKIEPFVEQQKSPEEEEAASHIGNF